MLRFQTFGTIDLRREDGERLDELLDQPKRLALLAVLAAHQSAGPVRREKLISLLWPESAPSSARTALSTTLSRLRDTLGEEALRGRGEESIALSGITSARMWPPSSRPVTRKGTGRRRSSTRARSWRASVPPMPGLSKSGWPGVGISTPSRPTARRWRRPVTQATRRSGASRRRVSGKPERSSRCGRRRPGRSWRSSRAAGTEPRRFGCTRSCGTVWTRRSGSRPPRS